MTNQGTPTPPGHYRASDGRDYPIPEGHVLGADGQLHRLPAPPPAAPPPPTPGAPSSWAPPAGPSVASTPPPPSGASSPASSTWTWDLTSILLLAGSAVVVVGAFLPWVTAGPFSKAGTDGDGALTLVLGLAAAALGAFGLVKASRGMAISAAVAAGLVVLIAIVDMADVASTDIGFGIEPAIGTGLYLTLVGGIAALIGTVLAFRARRTTP